MCACVRVCDLDNNISSTILKFVDDTKVFRRVNNDGDKHLQNDLDKLVKWSEKWQMLLNFGKCKCLHIGHGNLDVNYKMRDTVLGTTVKEKDLGVTISADMKVSDQCGIAASKWFKKFKMIPELRYLSYEERLKECGSITLETRWLRGDQIVFKILNGYENMDRNIVSHSRKIIELEDMR